MAEKGNSVKREDVFSEKVTTMELLNNNVGNVKHPPIAAEDLNTTGYSRGKAQVRTLCPHAVKSPCLLCTRACCRQTGGCSPDLAQSQGIFSSPLKAVCRAQQGNQHLCKHLVITTQGAIRASPLNHLSEAGAHSDDQNIPAMKRNMQNVEEFLKMLMFHLLNAHFLKKPLFGQRKQFCSYACTPYVFLI